MTHTNEQLLDLFLEGKFVEMLGSYTNALLDDVEVSGFQRRLLTYAALGILQELTKYRPVPRSQQKDYWCAVQIATDFVRRQVNNNLVISTFGENIHWSSVLEVAEVFEMLGRRKIATDRDPQSRWVLSKDFFDIGDVIKSGIHAGRLQIVLWRAQSFIVEGKKTRGMKNLVKEIFEAEVEMEVNTLDKNEIDFDEFDWDLPNYNLRGQMWNFGYQVMLSLE